MPIAPEWTTDYVISSNASARGVDLFLGSSRCAERRADAATDMDSGCMALLCFDDAERWTLETSLAGAHTDIVRFAFVNAANSVCFAFESQPF